MSRLRLNARSGRIVGVVGLLLSFSSWSDCLKGHGMRFTIKPGETFCMYQPMNYTDSLIVSYVVLDSSQGARQIDFLFYEPDGKMIAKYLSESKGSATVPVLEESQVGDYEICFYNGYHLLSTKTIGLSTWIVPSWQEGSEPEWARMSSNSTEIPEEEYDVRIEDIRKSLDKVRTSTDKVVVFQAEHQHREKTGRSIGEHNHDRVNYLSFFYSCTMVIVGIVQVVLVKGFFNLDKGPRFWNLWKG